MASKLVSEKLVKCFVNTLNDAFKADPKAIKKLFGTRVKVNKDIINGDLIVDENDTLGIVGVINGMIGIHSDYAICAVYDEKDKMIGFDFD